MQFSVTNFKEEFSRQLYDAMCFVFEADAEVEVQTVEVTKKVLSTTMATFTGEFVAGEIYGSFRGNYSAKGDTASVERIYITICESPAESVIQYGSSQDILKSLMNAHKLYFTRERLAPKQYEIIAAECEKLTEIAKTLPENRKEAFTKSIEMIRSQIMIDFDINKATDQEHKLG